MMASTQTVLPEPTTTALTSALIAGTVALGIWLLTTATGTSQAALVASLAGGLLGLSSLLHGTNTPVGRALTSLLLPVVAVVGLIAVGLPLRDVLVPGLTAGEPVFRPLVGQLGMTIAAGMATFGVIATRHRDIGNGAIAELWQTAVITVFGIAVALGGLMLIQLDAVAAIGLPGVDGAVLSRFVFEPTEPALVLVTFWGLTTLCVGTLKLFVSVAPIIELTPQTSQQRVTAGMARTHRWLNVIFVLLCGLTLVLWVFTMSTTDISRFTAQYPAVFAVFASSGLRSGLVAASGGLLCGGLLFWTLQFVTGSVTTAVDALVPAILAGVASVAVAIVGSPIVPRLIERLPETTPVPVDELSAAMSPPGVLLTGITVVMGLLTLVLSQLSVAGGMKYIPQQGAGSAIASGSLGLGAVTVAISGGDSLVVFGLVATSVFVWSVGNQSLTTRAELQATPAIQLEAIHSLSSLSLAVVGVLLARGLYTTVLGRIMVDGGTLVGVLASVIGIVVLIPTLRG